MTVVRPTELDRTLRGLREGHAGPAALAEDPLVGDLVIVRTATKIFRRDLLQFLLRVHPGRVSGPRHRVDGLAAAAVARPRQVLRRVAPGHHHFVPGDAEDLGRHAVTVADRLGAVIADSGLDVQTPVRLDDEEAVEARGARAVRAHRDADATYLRCRRACRSAPCVPPT